MKITPKGRKKRDKQMNKQKKKKKKEVFKVETVIKVDIEDLVKLYAEKNKQKMQEM